MPEKFSGIGLAMIRLFAALAIPPELGHGLVVRQQGVTGARWRPLEAFHVTIRFFGDVPEDVAVDIDDALAQVRCPPLDLTLSGVGVFGEGEEAHAVWTGLEENPDLRVLAKQCETAARHVGLAPDGRRYIPHVTLAYLRRPAPSEVGQWLADHSLLKSPTFQISSFGLYSSWQSSQGSRYRLEREYELESVT